MWKKTSIPPIINVAINEESPILRVASKLVNKGVKSQIPKKINPKSVIVAIVFPYLGKMKRSPIK
jgi:hypothetical protein